MVSFNVDLFGSRESGLLENIIVGAVVLAAATTVICLTAHAITRYYPIHYANVMETPEGEVQHCACWPTQ